MKLSPSASVALAVKVSGCLVAISKVLGSIGASGGCSPVVGTAVAAQAPVVSVPDVVVTTVMELPVRQGG